MTNTRRAIGLEAARSDGWFQRLGDDSPNFRQLCDVVGEHFVAFSVIAGVRISALTVDRTSPDATLVDFLVGDDPTEQRLPLGEFRRRLCAALLQPEPVPEVPLQEEDVDSVQGLIGFRYVLLAPIFGFKLMELLPAEDDEPAVLRMEARSQSLEMTIDAFREAIRERIRRELDLARPISPFSIDLSVLPDAEQAMAEEDYDRVIDVLGAWPGPLSLLLRTTEGQQLEPTVKATLARALGYLGTAYVRAQRYDWAEEVMRLGIQWGQEGPAAGELFQRMGDAHVTRGRHGEAIGLLRRALSLGAERGSVLPLLAQCYAERKRWVAAALCAEEALALDVDKDAMRTLRDRAQEVLGEPWERFREVVTPPAPEPQTIRPPRKV